MREDSEHPSRASKGIISSTHDKLGLSGLGVFLHYRSESRLLLCILGNNTCMEPFHDKNVLSRIVREREKMNPFFEFFINIVTLVVVFQISL
jgi:hypothetical protein